MTEDMRVAAAWAWLKLGTQGKETGEPERGEGQKGTRGMESGPGLPLRCAALCSGIQQVGKKK